jgi:sugar porter (SP) family MFS transporter
MSNSLKEVQVNHIDTLDNDDMLKGQVEERQVFSAAMAEALAKDPPRPYSKSMIKLYLILCVGYMCSATSGFDANTFGGILAMPNFTEYFNSRGGSTEGLITSLYVIGNMIGALPAGPIADRWGRKSGIITGSAFALIGIIIQTAAINTHMLMAGRFLLGLGVGVVQASGPAFVAELSHPAYRGIMTGIYQTCFFVGTIVTTWLEFGLNYVGNKPVTWRFPLAFQAVPSLIILFTVWFVPETPRWLVGQGRDEEARQLLAKYHGNGNLESPIVELEMMEMKAAIDLEGSDKRWWDLRDFFMTRSARYRTYLVVAVALFATWDLPPTSYYLPLMVKTAGITDVTTQLLLNAIQTPVMFVAAICGSKSTDLIGRRKMFIIGSSGMTLSMIVITACTARQAGHPAVGGTGIAFIYVFLVSFAFGWTPLQSLYISEILTFSTRAKGLALFSLVSNGAGFLNTYLPPVAIQNVGYKFYFFYTIWDFVGIIVIYFTFIETRRRTLEEIEDIFHDPHPVKASLQRQKVYIARTGEVYMAEN